MLPSDVVTLILGIAFPAILLGRMLFKNYSSDRWNLGNAPWGIAVFAFLTGAFLDANVEAIHTVMQKAPHSIAGLFGYESEEEAEEAATTATTTTTTTAAPTGNPFPAAHKSAFSYSATTEVWTIPVLNAATDGKVKYYIDGDLVRKVPADPANPLLKLAGVDPDTVHFVILLPSGVESSKFNPPH